MHEFSSGVEMRLHTENLVEFGCGVVLHMKIGPTQLVLSVPILKLVGQFFKRYWMRHYPNQDNWNTEMYSGLHINLLAVTK